MAHPTIRDRRALPNPSRKLDLIAPEEIGLAILTLVEHSYGITRDELPNAVCRLFGFGRVTEDMQSTVDTIVHNLLGTRKLVSVGDMIQPPTA